MKADTDNYLSMMKMIIGRIDITQRLIHNQINMPYIGPKIETIALQMRMIIESIALATLTANKSEFEKEGDKFKRFWKAESIFKDIEKKNPNFYPQPVVITPPLNMPDVKNMPDIKADIKDIKTGFMTRDEIIKVHSKCCDILHAPNPYSLQNKEKYENFLAQVPQWINLIIKLLDQHRFQLLNKNGFYLVKMLWEKTAARVYYSAIDDNFTNAMNRYTEE